MSIIKIEITILNQIIISIQLGILEKAQHCINYLYRKEYLISSNWLQKTFRWLAQSDGIVEHADCTTAQG